MIKLKNLIKESISIPKTGKEIEQVLKKILPNEYFVNLNRFKKADIKINSLQLNARLNKRDYDYYFKYESEQKIGTTIIGERIYISMTDIIEVSSVSLADPKAMYQTTSARRVKNKKIKSQEYIETEKEFINFVSKHIKKVNSVLEKL